MSSADRQREAMFSLGYDRAFRYVLGDALSDDVQAYFVANRFDHGEESTLHLTSREQYEQEMRKRLLNEEERIISNMNDMMIRAVSSGGSAEGYIYGLRGHDSQIEEALQNIMAAWDKCHKDQNDDPVSVLAALQDELGSLAGPADSLSYQDALRLRDIPQEIIQRQKDVLRERVVTALKNSPCKMTIHDFRAVQIGAFDPISSIEYKVFQSLPLATIKEIYFANEKDTARILSNVVVDSVPRGYDAVIAKGKMRGTIDLDTLEKRGKPISEQDLRSKLDLTPDQMF